MNRRSFLLGASSLVAVAPVAKIIPAPDVWHHVLAKWSIVPLGEVYFNPGTYLDLTVAANRQKFYNAAAKPVA